MTECSTEKLIQSISKLVISISNVSGLNSFKVATVLLHTQHRRLLSGRFLPGAVQIPETFSRHTLLALPEDIPAYVGPQLTL